MFLNSSDLTLTVDLLIFFVGSRRNAECLCKCISVPPHIRAKCSVGLCVFLQPDLDLNIDYSAALMYRIAHDIMSFNGM